MENSREVKPYKNVPQNSHEDVTILQNLGNYHMILTQTTWLCCQELNCRTQRWQGNSKIKPRPRLTSGCQLLLLTMVTWLSFLYYFII